MSASVSPAVASAFAVAGTGPMPIVAGGTPPTPHETSRANGRSPSSAARSGCVTTQIAAPSFWPDALPAVTVASGSLRPMIGRSPASTSTRRVGADVLVGRRRLAATGTISSANRLASRAAAARWWLRTANSSCSSREMPYSRRRFSAVSIIPPGTGKFAPPAVTRPRASASCSMHAGAAAHAPAHRRRVERRVGHRLGAAREHDLRRAALHLHRRVEHGLQPRAAAPVDLQPGRGDGEPRVERHDPADRGRLHRGVAVAEQHVVDGGRVESGALEQRPHDGGGQLVRRDVAQCAAEAADRRAQRLADDRVTHTDE